MSDPNAADKYARAQVALQVAASFTAISSGDLAGGLATAQAALLAKVTDPGQVALIQGLFTIGNAQITVLSQATSAIPLLNPTVQGVASEIAAGITAIASTYSAPRLRPEVQPLPNLRRIDPMKKILTLLCALALAGVALAQSASVNKLTGQTATLAWTAPTANTNGTAVAGALSYNLYSCPSGTAAGAAASSCTQVTSGLSATTYTTAPFTAPGTFNYAVTAVEAGQESVLSNLVSAVVTAPPPIPNPPAGATIK